MCQLRWKCVIRTGHRKYVVDLMKHLKFTMGHGKSQLIVTYVHQNETCDILKWGMWYLSGACGHYNVTMLQWILVVNVVKQHVTP